MFRESPMSVSAGELSRNFGAWQSRALAEPVTITHHGQPRLVLASVAAFKRGGTDADEDAEGRRARTRLRVVLNEIDEGFIAFDPGLRIVELNRAAELYLGAEREQLVGRDLRDLTPQTRGSALWDCLQRAMRSGRVVEREIRAWVRPGGALRVRAFPLDERHGAVLFQPRAAAEQAGT
jgi:PAS domain S-box-containing protein